MLKLVVKSPAWADIEAAATWLADRNPEAAEHFLQATEATFDLLLEQPELGQPRRTFPDVRYWRVNNFENYLIFYRVLPAELQILAVLHGARDLPPILRGRI